jgi:MFS family permease
MSQHRGTRHQLSADQWFLLFVLGMAVFLEGFSVFSFTAALPAIRSTFGLSQADASLWMGAIFVASIPALFITRYADVHGRRRILLGSLVGYLVFTLATAVSTSIASFVYAQFIARLFLNAEVAIAWTMVSEEVPARSRGFAFGWLATLSAVGAAFAAGLYGSLFAPIGVSWRALYFVALAPATVVLFLKRGLPETESFIAAQREHRLVRHWYEIFARPHRRWVLLSGGAEALFGAAIMADVFIVDFMVTSRGMSTTSADLIVSVASILAIPAALAAGSLGDRFGRKRVGCFFACVEIAGILGFFLLARSRVEHLAYLLLILMGQYGAWPTLDALYAGLFPTEVRVLAASVTRAGRVPGEIVGMVLGSALVVLTGRLGAAVAILSAGPVFAILLVWRLIPDRERDRTAPTVPLEQIPMRLVG